VVQKGFAGLHLPVLFPDKQEKKQSRWKWFDSQTISLLNDYTNMACDRGRSLEFI